MPAQSSCPVAAAAAAVITCGRLSAVSPCNVGYRTLLMPLHAFGCFFRTVSNAQLLFPSQAAAFPSTCPAVIVSARHDIGRIFSKDEEVLRVMAQVAPMCALFQVGPMWDITSAKCAFVVHSMQACISTPAIVSIPCLCCLPFSFVGLPDTTSCARSELWEVSCARTGSKQQAVDVSTRM